MKPLRPALTSHCSDVYFMVATPSICIDQNMSPGSKRRPQFCFGPLDQIGLQRESQPHPGAR